MSQRHYWKARLVSGGPFIGVCTWFGPPWVAGEELDRSPRWQALCRTETTARAILFGDHVPIEVDGMMLKNLTPTTKDDYEYLVSHAQWATAHAPMSPDAAPRETINWNKLKPVW